MDLKTYREEIEKINAVYEAAKVIAWQETINAFERGECSHPATEDHNYYDDLIAPARAAWLAARKVAHAALDS